MAVSNEIDTLKSHIIGALDAVHDFKEHTTVVWRVFQESVKDGTTVKSTNVDTGNVVTEKDLVKLAQQYNAVYLLEYTFLHVVTLMETFVFDLLRILLIHQPKYLNQKKQIDVGKALSVSDHTALVCLLADRELNELKYSRIEDWFSRLHDMVSIDFPDGDEIDQLAEIKVSRDIIVHNSGIVNEIYIDKAGKKARHKVGDRLEIDGSYHRMSWMLIKKMITEVSDATASKLAAS